MVAEKTLLRITPLLSRAVHTTVAGFTPSRFAIAKPVKN